MFDKREPEKRLYEELAVACSTECFNVLIGTHNWFSSGELPEEFLARLFGMDTLKDILVLPESTDMYDILVRMGFTSRSDAKKNWVKSEKDIEPGCHSFLVGKAKKALFIFKPGAPFTGDYFNDPEEVSFSEAENASSLHEVQR